MHSDLFSIYRMENNTFLGDSLVIVYHATDEEVKSNGLTNSDIAIYLKTPKDITEINSIGDMRIKDLFDLDKSIILRVASECQFGVFGDSHCDCESQRTACLEAINTHGQGMYVHLPQEGQGRGLHYKARELQLQVHGTNPNGEYIGKKDIYEASRILTGTKNVDIRSFAILKKIFKELDLIRYSYILASSNPQKASALAEEVGIAITGSQDVQRSLNLDNVGEYLAKIYKKSFSVSDDDMRVIYEVLFNAKIIPERVMSLLRYIRDDISLGRVFAVNPQLLEKVANLARQSSVNSPIDMLDESSENRYREYQVEIAISDKDAELLLNAGIIAGLKDVSFEQNYFYDVVYLKNTVARDLKIRRKTQIDGKKELLESRLIYKTPVGESEYEIKNLSINDKEVADLLSNSLEGYEVFYVPVFTHTCVSSYDSSLLMLIKRYSMGLRTLSIMGKKAEVKRVIRDISHHIKVEITPDPTNIRTINRNLSLDFDYELLSQTELDFFNQYKELQS